MQAYVYYPKDIEKRQELAGLIATVHADAVRQKLQSISASFPKETMGRLIEEIKCEYKAEQENF